MKNEKIKFFKKINNYNSEERVAYMLTYTSAPLLEELKPAMVLSIKFEEEFYFYKWVLKDIGDKNIKFKMLGKNNFTKTYLIYNRKNLEKHLKKEENKLFLNQNGYDSDKELEYNIELLKKRFLKEQFPHEIGIFLGYPLRDVKNFIEDTKGNNSIYTGYWKVYDNLEKSKAIFKKFDSAKTRVIQKTLQNETPQKILLEILEEKQYKDKL